MAGETVTHTVKSFSGMVEAQYYENWNLKQISISRKDSSAMIYIYGYSDTQQLMKELQEMLGRVK